MKLKIAIIVGIWMMTVKFTYAQQACNCEGTLVNLISKIESEYPGLAEKTKDSLLYKTLKRSLLSESKTTTDSLCLRVLEKYTTFFKDRHIWILPVAKTNMVKQTEGSPATLLNINIKDFKKRLSHSSDQLEGIWKNESYTVGLVNTGINEYTAFIIQADWKVWKPKEIKFKLSGTNGFEYRMQDHSMQKGTYQLHNESILYLNEIKSAFVKQGPMAKLDSIQALAKINEIEGFYVRQLSSKTTLIRLANFSYGYVERIEQLIAQHKDLLEKSENLIIDLRDNGGGTDLAYAKLMPFIATNPIRHVGVEYLATPTLIDGLTTYKNGLKDEEKNRSTKAGIDRDLALFKQNMGRFVNTEGKSVVIDTISLATHSPKQVIILSNQQVASAAENLLLAAKQSKKVKIMGTPSSGVLDYASARFFNFGCPNYQLLLPTYRSLRLPNYPIDNIGVQPDIYLDATVKDWTAYALHYVEENFH